jgi:RNA polymerase sigma-70 factor (ECF subfamily)
VRIIVEKAILSGDPDSFTRRICRMMLDARTADNPDARPDASHYAGGAAVRGGRTQGRTVENGTAEEDWAALLIRVRDCRDKAAFAALYRQFAPRVKAFLMKSGAGAAVAEEAAQDVMATLWQKAALYDPARASVATWVFTIARNRRIDALRRTRPEPEDLPWGPEPEPDQAEAYEAAEDTRRLGEAIAQLPQKQRELIERAYYGELSHTEIAAETGLPLGTIKSRIRLALERLRQQLGP